MVSKKGGRRVGRSSSVVLELEEREGPDTESGDGSEFESSR